ncbi:interleukin-10 [Testudinid alphaherpesvirus 3]|uniref:Viral interleukin-10 homolog n=1 Tax=Testudinid alphaherpesvirus 3 TaxID=2560801 RepID=A0A0M3LCQ9_9ALPH|nr:interleukin-10 [Testudinid alphaherpesvirus 3]AIU39318.1 interleukin-10 [Testudinid alphaherpesvirus 3]
MFQLEGIVLLVYLANWVSPATIKCVGMSTLFNPELIQLRRLFGDGIKDFFQNKDEDLDNAFLNEDVQRELASDCGCDHLMDMLSLYVNDTIPKGMKTEDAPSGLGQMGQLMSSLYRKMDMCWSELGCSHNTRLTLQEYADKKGGWDNKALGESDILFDALELFFSKIK